MAVLQKSEESEHSDEQLAQYFNNDQLKELKLLKERKGALQSKNSQKDVNMITHLQTVMKSQKLNLFDDIDEHSADDIQKIFNIQSKEEVEDILRRTERVQKAVLSLRDESSEFLENFHMDRIIEQTYYRKRANPVTEYQSNAFDLNQFNDFMLHTEIEDEGDAVFIMGEAHDATLRDLKEQLLEAVNKRKGKVLNIALSIFNKMQG